jgi:hypothetical protein
LLVCATTALAVALAPAAALGAPSVSITGVSSGSTVTGTVALGASVSSGTTQVKWYVDYVEQAWDGSSPFQYSWNSASVDDGSHVVFAKATDSSGVWSTSAYVKFNVANSISSWTSGSGVAVTSPYSGQSVSGTVTLGATASDPSGITQMKWFVDGSEVWWDGSAPFQGSWSSLGVADGTHSIQARAANGKGTWLSSPTISFTVKNAGTATPTPSGWKLVMSDSFDSSTLDTTKWQVYGPNWSGNSGNGLRDGRAVSIQNGTLTLTAQMLNGTLVSGAVRTRLDQRYGRFEFRARTDTDPSGTMSGVVLTWPQSGNFPTDGENDIYETLNKTTRNTFYSFIHYSSQNRQYYFEHYADATQWHHMAMEWEPTALRIYRDGALVWTLTDTYAIPDVAHHLCVQLDAFKQWLPGTVRMQVDDVRIYTR